MYERAATTHWQVRTALEKMWNVYAGDAQAVLETLPRNAYHCVVTSPPYYWQRDYGVDGQIGQEETVEEYVDALLSVMDEIQCVLRPDGLLFLNLGDTYYSGKGEPQGPDRKNSKRRLGLRAVDKSGGLGIGLQRKSSIGVPWRVAIAMSERNWVLRSPIIWHRENSLPESVQDRPRRSHEYIFMFAKSRKYYFNRQSLVDIGEEDVWHISARPEQSNGLRTAPYPDEIVKRCLDIGCPPDGNVLDPFAGSGTTVRVAIGSGRHGTGIDLNPEFCQYMVDRFAGV